MSAEDCPFVVIRKENDIEKKMIHMSNLRFRLIQRIPMVWNQPCNWQNVNLVTLEVCWVVHSHLVRCNSRIDYWPWKRAPPIVARRKIIQYKVPLIFTISEEYLGQSRPLNVLHTLIDYETDLLTMPTTNIDNRVSRMVEIPQKKWSYLLKMV